MTHINAASNDVSEKQVNGSANNELVRQSMPDNLSQSASADISKRTIIAKTRGNCRLTGKDNTD